jgi:hypothetical protein
VRRRLKHPKKLAIYRKYLRAFREELERSVDDVRRVAMAGGNNTTSIGTLTSDTTTENDLAALPKLINRLKVLVWGAPVAWSCEILATASMIYGEAWTLREVSLEIEKELTRFHTQIGRQQVAPPLTYDPTGNGRRPVRYRRIDERINVLRAGRDRV